MSGAMSSGRTMPVKVTFCASLLKPTMREPSIRSVLLGKTSLTSTESVVVSEPERVVEPVPLLVRELFAVRARSRKRRVISPVPPKALTDLSREVLVSAADCAVVFSAMVMVSTSPTACARVSAKSEAALALLLPFRARLACFTGKSELARRGAARARPARRIRILLWFRERIVLVS